MCNTFQDLGILYGTVPQAGIDPPAQSHASNEAIALPQATTAGSQI